MDLFPAEMVWREINHTTWIRGVGSPVEGRAHLVSHPVPSPVSCFSKADMLPAVLDPLQYLIVYQAGDGIDHRIHKWKMLNLSFLTLMGAGEEEKEQEGLKRGGR